MQYGEVPGLDLKVSRIVQGAIMISSSKMDECFTLLDGLFELGCNTIDTAHVYGGGDVERTVGRWIEERGLRDRIVIIGKGAHFNDDRHRVTPYDITSDLHDSLARLRTDYIDIYMLHRDEPTVPVGPIVEILNEHVDAGLIKAFGGSNWTHDRIQEANDYAAKHDLTPFVTSSPNFTLAEQVKEPWEGCISIGGPSNVDARDWYEETQLSLFTWSTLARGFFSGKITRDNFRDAAPNETMANSFGYEQNFARLDRVEELAKEKEKSVPQIALSYVMNQPMNIFALVGCYNVGELTDNLEALELKLTTQEIEWLDLRRIDR